jgi:hypothetical protein
MIFPLIICSSTMVADASLADLGALVNPSFMKGNQFNRRVSTCSKGGHSLIQELEETFCPISHKFLVEQVVMSNIFLLHVQRYSKALLTRDTTIFGVLKSSPHPGSHS